MKSYLLLLGLLCATASDAATYLYVVSEGSRNIVRFNGTTGAFKDVLASGGQLSRPHDMIFGGPNKNLYIADGGRNGVLEFDARTGTYLRTFATGGQGECWGVDFAPNGNILSLDASGNSVYEFNINTGAYLGYFITPGLGGLNSSRGAVFGPANDFYVSGGGGAQTIGIWKYNATTKAFISQWGTSVSWGDLNDMEYGPDGNLFVLDRGFSKRNIVKLNRATGASMGVFVSQGAGGMVEPRDLVFGPNGNLFVADQSANGIYQFSSTTGLFINLFASGGGMNSITSLVFADPGDNIVPNTYLITIGDQIFGNLASLAASDNNRLCLMNNPDTLSARIEVGGTSTVAVPTQFSVAWESSVAQYGIVETMELRNYSTNTWTFVFGGVAPTVDQRTEFSVSSNAANYVSSNRDVRCRFKWEPINDEDPAQDGWIHCLDQVEWTVR